MLGTTSMNIRAASLNFSYLRCSHLYILDKPQGLKDEDKRGHWNHAWAQPIRPWPGLDTVPRMGLVPREVTPRVLVCHLVDAATAQWADNVGHLEKTILKECINQNISSHIKMPVFCRKNKSKILYITLLSNCG